MADVLICNFRPGTLAKLGLDYDNLTRIKPDIIVAELPALGGKDRCPAMPRSALPWRWRPACRR